jgi:hypothetical protein
MTLDVYADLFDDELDDVAVALDDAHTISVVGELWANGQSAGAVVPADPSKTKGKTGI